jgi:hypothetical protein
MEKNEKEESVIITPKDIGVRGSYKEYFYCPKCKSSVVSLNETFVKNNVANSIDNNKVEEEGVLPFDFIKIKNDSKNRMVLICNNCNHCDLLVNFLVEEKRIGFIGDVRKIQGVSGYPYVDKVKKDRIRYDKLNKNKTWQKS